MPHLLELRSPAFSSRTESSASNNLLGLLQFEPLRLELLPKLPRILAAAVREGSIARLRVLTFTEEFSRLHPEFHSSLAMASMGAQIVSPRGGGPYCFRIHGQVYHSIGPLHPSGGQPRQFGQLYILDTAEATEQRLRLSPNHQCDPALMERLTALMSQLNPYARLFKMMYELEQAEERCAQQESRLCMSLRMLFSDARPSGLQGRLYDLPSTNEVAIVYFGEDGDVPETRAIAVHSRFTDRTLTYISYLDKRCDPLTSCSPRARMAGIQICWIPLGNESVRSSSIRISCLSEHLSILSFVLANCSNSLLSILS